MDFIVTWSPQVRDDLNDIAAYIAKDSSRYASAVVSRIVAAGRTLQFLPARGRLVPELGLDDHREIFVHEYRLIYRIEGEKVHILAVIHARRLLGNTRLGDQAERAAAGRPVRVEREQPFYLQAVDGYRRARVPEGPWGQRCPQLPPAGVWVEGPTVIKLGDWWHVYFDKYRDKHYGVIRSKDFTHWEDLSDQLAVPAGIRHGTVLRVPRAMIDGLE